MTELPQSYYDPSVRLRTNRAFRILVAAAIALIGGWHALGLPGGMLQRLQFPADIPGFGHGLRSVAVQDDGTWIIRRSYYADRMSRYVISPLGELSRDREAGMVPDPDQSNPLGLGTMQLPGGTTMKIKPARSYYESIAASRQQALGNNKQQLAESASKQQSINSGPPRFVGPEQPHVIVMTYSDIDLESPILLGHQYYEVLDSGSFRPPYLWLTTDRLKYLHLIHLTDVTGELEIEELLTVPLDLGMVPTHDTSMGIDPTREELFIVTATGDRFWFDPQTLESRGQDKLPGMWEREFAQIAAPGVTRGEFPQYVLSGWPLSEPAYWRLQRVLVLAFLGGLLWLLVEWRLVWRYTSARTTADMS